MKISDLLTRARAEIISLLDGETCDHSVGICLCSTHSLVQELEVAADSFEDPPTGEDLIAAGFTMKLHDDNGTHYRFESKEQCDEPGIRMPVHVIDVILATAIDQASYATIADPADTEVCSVGKALHRAKQIRDKETT